MSTSLLSYHDVAQGTQQSGWQMALLPVGCFEQHGPELPLATDILQAEELSRRLAARLREDGLGSAYMLPPICYTPTEPNKDYAGTVSVPNDAFRPYIEAVLRGILRSSYSHLVIVNSHGSVDGILKETAFKIVLEQFESDSTSVRPILCLNTFDAGAQVEAQFGQAPGRHAEWTELLMSFGILGESYFDEQRLKRLKTFAAAHDFTVRMPKVLGIPARYRSVDGVQGAPWPNSDRNLKDLSREYWQLIESTCYETMVSELQEFAARFS